MYADADIVFQLNAIEMYWIKIDMIKFNLCKWNFAIYS